MANASSTQGREVTVQHGQDECQLLLFDGVEPGAIMQAVSARLGLGDSRFYFTQPGAEAVVPLSASLPHGLTLALHLCTEPEREIAGPVRRRTKGSRGVSFDATVPKPETKAATDVVVPDGSAPLAATNVASEGSIASASSQPLLSASVVGPADAAHDTSRDVEMAPKGQEHAHSPSRSFSHSHAEDDAHAILAEECAQVAAATASVDRYSRLATDLANERTLLAWIRTGLAAIRTVFSFFGLSAVGLLHFSVFATQVGMVCLALIAGLAGYVRYTKIKRATLMPLPPAHFGRGSVAWFMSVLGFCTVSVALGVVSEAWYKG